MNRQTEDTRVKIPTILHLMRLGYEYLSIKEYKDDFDGECNILVPIFVQSLKRINPSLKDDDINRLLTDIKLELKNNDLGQAFFERLQNQSGTKLIDFTNFDNNSFHVVTELPCITQTAGGDEEFRPDITLLINGMPLVFIEVKKPNNRDGVIAERKRINTRFANPNFRSFVNITQLMIFSNNMEYDIADPEPVTGAFYATTSYSEVKFNYFREEAPQNTAMLLKDISEAQEKFVLKDTNNPSIYTSPEFQSNKHPDRPTNRICTSLLSRERLAFMLRYALVYVKEDRKAIQKHVMRYPQMFATFAINHSLDNGVKKGVVWHTQGSGKTALTFYNVQFLTDYFAKRGVIPKFYFIVDRLDLLQQADREFKARGLIVHSISSREAFSKDIKSTQALHNHSGKPEITVVNIHKFKDDPHVISTNDYNVNIQRVYFLDEVHRSYDPKGSFLANLEESDRQAIKIGLTGTPLIGSFSKKDDTAEQKNKQHKTTETFGSYIHKYYYNASIADGYTLRLMREAIESNYQIQLNEILKKLKVEKGSIDRKAIYSDKKFVEPMLDYIINDFETSRGTMQDDTIGAMVICDSSDQAKLMHQLFVEKYQTEPRRFIPRHATSSALILHDIGTKEERKDWVEDFKAGKIDILFVYNMLLTGFDAPRLKKLYLGRLIKAHNLLQALTRVNRPYKDFRFGYVVDFADISKEFDKTNKAYFDELQGELGDDIEGYSQLFKTSEEINQDIAIIKNALFEYSTENAERFSDEISQINDKAIILELNKALSLARELYNVARFQGDYDVLKRLDFEKLNLLYRYTNDRLAMLNLQESLQQGDTTNLLNQALEDIVFQFKKVSEAELKLADDLKDSLRKTREGLLSNFDKDDPEFIALREELERIFKKKNLGEVSQVEMRENMALLDSIYVKVKELNRKNELIRNKYQGDAKFARIHKRLMAKPEMSREQAKIHEALTGVKADADEKVLNLSQILENVSFFENQMMPSVIKRFKMEQKLPLDVQAIKSINQMILKEYLEKSSSKNLN